MVVDDSAFIRKMIRTILSRANYDDIIEASSGEDAIRLFKSEKPDLVLLDIIMTEKMNGIDTLKELKLIDPLVKVIMVTVVDQPFVEEEAKKLGASFYIKKPFDETDLIEAVNKALKA